MRQDGEEYHDDISYFFIETLCLTLNLFKSVGVDDKRHETCSLSLLFLRRPQPLLSTISKRVFSCDGFGNTF